MPPRRARPLSASRVDLPAGHINSPDPLNAYPDWGESLKRYRQDFEHVSGFLSISNVFRSDAEISYDEFRTGIRDKKISLHDRYGWPWFGTPPPDKQPEWQSRRGVRLSYFEEYYWDCLKAGHFLFCTSKLNWEEDDRTSVSVNTMLYHLLVDLTYAARIATAFGISGAGGRVELRLHGVKGRKLDCDMEFQHLFPECTEDYPAAAVDCAFSESSDAIRRAAIDLMYELLASFPKPFDGSRLIDRNQMEQPAGEIQKKNGLLGEALWYTFNGLGVEPWV